MRQKEQRLRPLRKSRSIYDESGCYCNKRLDWAWIAQTVYFTLVFHGKSRKGQELEDRFGDLLERMTAVTDRHSAYFALHFLNHQVCLAHLLRECQYHNEPDREQVWSKSVESLLILNFMITPGDVDDREPLKVKSFVEFIYGKLVGDKGYIGKDLFCKLFIDGIQLITKLKNNMRDGLRSMYDRILLRKRAIIETINDELKNIAQIEHSRHRSLPNFIVILIGGIAAYCLFPKKPMINFERVYDNQLTLF